MPQRQQSDHTPATEHADSAVDILAVVIKQQFVVEQQFLIEQFLEPVVFEQQLFIIEQFVQPVLVEQQFFLSEFRLQRLLGVTPGGQQWLPLQQLRAGGLAEPEFRRADRVY